MSETDHQRNGLAPLAFGAMVARIYITKHVSLYILTQYKYNHIIVIC